MTPLLLLLTLTTSASAPPQPSDPLALLDLLRQGKYAELTREVERCQAAFEADPYFESLPIDALEAFGSLRKDEAGLLDKWVAKAPQSFAPLAARGAFLSVQGFRERGTQWAKDTSDKQFAAMANAHERARRDLLRARELRPKLVAADQLLLRMARTGAGETDDRKEILAHATAACPTCVRFRGAYLISLTPRWGGSYEAMDEYAHQEIRAHPEASRLQALLGWAYYDRCDQAWADKDFNLAIRFCNQAVEYGALPAFLLERAELLFQMKQPDKALADAEQALALQPTLYKALTLRAKLRSGENKNVEAAGDMLRAQALAPEDTGVRRLSSGVAANLLYEARAIEKRDSKKAKALVDLALKVDPARAKGR